MPIPATDYIWFNGKLVPWDKATVHVLSHALHYGSSVFEGIRAYATPRGVAIFRLRDHTRRLYDSAKIYRIQIPFEAAQIERPAARSRSTAWPAAPTTARGLRGYGEMGDKPKVEPPIDVAIAAWEWGQVLPMTATPWG
jgi:branched-chain amino acid aminotransferase